jgi:molybdopterin converting factor small subunit
MNVTVRFVSQLRDLAGTDEVSVALPEGATLSMLVGRLRERLPALYPVADRAIMMVNHQIAAPEMVLSDGDRIMMLQVLGGG